MLKFVPKKQMESSVGVKIINGAKDPMANAMLGVRLHNNINGSATGRSPNQQTTSMAEVKLPVGKMESYETVTTVGNVRFVQNPGVSSYSPGISGVGNLPYFSESNNSAPNADMKLNSYQPVAAYNNSQSTSSMAQRNGPVVNGVAHMNQFGGGFSPTNPLGSNPLANGHGVGPMGNSSNSSPLLLKLLRSNSPNSSEHPLPPTNASDIDDFIIETALQHHQQSTSGSTSSAQQQFFPPDEFQFQQQQHQFHQTSGGLDQQSHAYNNCQPGGQIVVRGVDSQQQQFTSQPGGMSMAQNSKLSLSASVSVEQYGGGLPSPTHRHFYHPHPSPSQLHPQQQHYGDPQGMGVGPTPYEKLLPFDCNPEISTAPSKKKRRLKKKTAPTAEVPQQHQPVNNHFYDANGVVMQPQTSYYPDPSQQYHSAPNNYPMMKHQDELRTDSQPHQLYNVVDHNVHTTASSSSHPFMQNCYGPNGGAFGSAQHPMMDVVQQPSHGQTNSKAKNPRKPRQSDKKGGGKSANGGQQTPQPMSQMPQSSNCNGDQQATFLQPSLPKKSKLSLDTQKQIAEDPFVQSAIDSVLSSVRASSAGGGGVGTAKVTRPNGFTSSYHSECNDGQVNGFTKSPESDRSFASSSDETDRGDIKSAAVRVSVEHFVSSMEKVVARGDEMDPNAMQHKLDPYDSRDFRVPNLFFDHGDFLHGGFDMNVGDFLAGDIDVILSDSGRTAGSEHSGSTSHQGAVANGKFTSTLSSDSSMNPFGKLSGCFPSTSDLVQNEVGVRSVSSTTSSSSPHLCTNDSTSPLVNGGGQLLNGPVAGVEDRSNKSTPPSSTTDGSGTPATIGAQNFVVSFGAVAV